MINIDLGFTYMADRVREDGTIIESAIDHIYVSGELEERIYTKKLEESSTDHLPIMVGVKTREKRKAEQKFVRKRCMKNFTQEKWKLQLAMKNWEKIGETEDVNEMAQHFNEKVIEALDECAPIKEMKIRQAYKDGLTDRTKAMIKERDRMRK